MQTAKFVYWEDDGAWLGYLQDFPDYWTQGESLDDLKAHLREINRHLARHIIKFLSSAPPTA